MLINAIDVRCLKRFVKTLYHIVNKASLSKFFSTSDNFVKCHNKANFCKHCEITFRNLFEFLCIVMFFSLSIKK